MFFLHDCCHGLDGESGWQKISGKSGKSTGSRDQKKATKVAAKVALKPANNGHVKVMFNTGIITASHFLRNREGMVANNDTC